MIVSIALLWIGSGYQSRAMEERYNGEWDNLCIYTNNVLLEKSSEYVDFDKFLEDKSSKKELDNYMASYNFTKYKGNKFTNYVGGIIEKSGDYFYKYVSTFSRDVIKKTKPTKDKPKNGNKKQ